MYIISYWNNILFGRSIIIIECVEIAYLKLEILRSRTREAQIVCKERVQANFCFRSEVLAIVLAGVAIRFMHCFPFVDKA